MLGFATAFLALTNVGSFYKEEVDSAMLDKIVSVGPEIESLMAKTGYNGKLPLPEKVREVWTQSVNGMMYVVRTASDAAGEEEVWFKFHEGVDGSLEAIDWGTKWKDVGLGLGLELLM